MKSIQVILVSILFISGLGLSAVATADDGRDHDARDVTSFVAMTKYIYDKYRSEQSTFEFLSTECTTCMREQSQEMKNRLFTTFEFVTLSIIKSKPQPGSLSVSRFGNLIVLGYEAALQLEPTPENFEIAKKQFCELSSQQLFTEELFQAVGCTQ